MMNNRMMNTVIKKVKADERTRAIIRNGLEIGQRSIFVISGDKPHDQIAKLYFILRQEEGNRDLVSKEVVWCYEDKLELRSRRKLAKQVECLRRHGVLDLEKCPPFSFFLEFAPITPCWYEDSERILGNNTFGMCVFQDFEVLTPNLLATTIQTVDVGGLVILLIPSWPQPPHIEEDLGVGGLHQTDVTPHDSPRRAVYQPIGSYTASASRQYGTIAPIHEDDH
ncbi:hypothetical protein Lser_V15G20564 [Lactuca serriola]